MADLRMIRNDSGEEDGEFYLLGNMMAGARFLNGHGKEHVVVDMPRHHRFTHTWTVNISTGHAILLANDTRLEIVAITKRVTTGLWKRRKG